MSRPACSASSSSAASHRSSDPSSVAVIVGANRGIGLAMTQALIQRGWKGKICATARDPSNAGALNALWQFRPDRFSVIKADVTDEDSVIQMAKEVKDIGNGRVDLVVCTAGILHEHGRMPETGLARVDKHFLIRNFEVNTVGVVLVAKHLTPLMITNRKEGRVHSVFAALSARVGSIEDNGLGGWMSYRVSKAAQNMAMRTLGVEVARRGIAVVSLHPGTVDTDLSQPFQKNVPKGKLFEPDHAARMLWDVIDRVEVGSTQYLDYAGKTIPY